jgi:hypothetical protein
MEAYRASEALETLVRVFTTGIPGVAADPEKAAAFKERLDGYHQHRDKERGDEEWSVATTSGSPRTNRPFRYANLDEAKGVLRAFMESFRRRSHSELVELVTKHHVERARGPTGAEYEINLHLYWDEQRDGNICVSGAIGRRGLEHFDESVPADDVGGVMAVRG